MKHKTQIQNHKCADTRTETKMKTLGGKRETENRQVERRKDTRQNDPNQYSRKADKDLIPGSSY